MVLEPNIGHTKVRTSSKQFRISNSWACVCLYTSVCGQTEYWVVCHTQMDIRVKLPIHLYLLISRYTESNYCQRHYVCFWCSMSVEGRKQTCNIDMWPNFSFSIFTGGCNNGSPQVQPLWISSYACERVQTLPIEHNDEVVSSIHIAQRDYLPDWPVVWPKHKSQLSVGHSQDLSPASLLNRGKNCKPSM
jgi:hypothetical protein